MSDAGDFNSTVFPSRFVFFRRSISEVSNAVLMSFGGAHRPSPTRHELSLFGINWSSFEESTCIGTSSKLDNVLLGWFDDNSKRLADYLSHLERQKPRKHHCTSPPGADPRECFWLSPQHHIRRSQRCPDLCRNPKLFPDDEVAEAKSQQSYASARESSDWDSYRHLEAIGHDFESLTLWEPLPPNVMDLVMAGAATREQLWVLEGVLYRQMHSPSSAEHRDKFVCLWLAVYRAKRGVQAPFEAFELLRKVTEQAAKLQDDKYFNFLPREIEYCCNDAWVSLLLYISKLRKRCWSNAADVLKGVEHSTERFRRGEASDDDGYSGEIPKVFGFARRGRAEVGDIERDRRTCCCKSVALRRDLLIYVFD